MTDPRIADTPFEGAVTYHCVMTVKRLVMIRRDVRRRVQHLATLAVAA